MNKKFIFTNLLGSFILNSKYMVIDKGNDENKLTSRYKNLFKPEGNELKDILNYFKKKQFFNEFYNKNIQLTKKQVKDSVNEDNFIINTINNIEELNKVTNTLVRRLREWYGLYLPEFTKELTDNEKFVELIQRKSKKQLLSEINVKLGDSMGAEFSNADLKPIMNLATEITKLYNLKESHELYLDRIMTRICPNMIAITGGLIGAKLVEHARSIKHLSELPASIVQLLGAEKALFRHLKSGAKSPKYGVIFDHPLISKAKRSDKGKVARALADKIAIAIKVDYFKGKFVGDTLRKGLEKRFDDSKSKR